MLSTIGTKVVGLGRQKTGVFLALNRVIQFVVCTDVSRLEKQGQNEPLFLSLQPTTVIRGSIEFSRGEIEKREWHKKILRPRPPNFTKWRSF